jgi:1-aminocyclopropane-1-carboxylate deaminase/D-cysteine desulfhydrase-like pyridoxal-dependent ACC family enzyme
VEWPDLPPAIAALPRFRLFDSPTPLAPLPRFSAATGGQAEIWIKREDLLPLGFGGNKLRNLEFLIGDALSRGADTLVTSGRRWSNHCRLTAAAGAKAGLTVHLVLSGPPAGRPGANQRLDRLLGATVHVASTAERSDRTALVERVVSDQVASGRRPYVIGVGGSGPIGAAGQVIAGMELASQARAAGLDRFVVALPSATGGTQAGVLSGLRLAGSPARVLGVAVTAPAADLRPSIVMLLEGLRPLTGLGVAGTEVDLVDADGRPASYGVRSPAATAATALLARTEGIFVDPIYTAKALAELVARVRDGRITGRAVFWHAGGTTGLFESLSPATAPRAAE